MHVLSTATITSVFVALLLVAANSPLLHDYPLRWNTCCDSLNSLLPGKVSYAGDPDYDSRQASYYAGTQSVLMPSCRVRPDNASDISSIVRMAVTKKCRFAVVSGGHMSWDASNINAPGFSLDLASLNTVSLSDDRAIATLGPGARWGEVYEHLINYGLYVAGGRASEVGVGGFLLGGGISWYSYSLGFGSISVVGYEIVLSNGTILQVSTTEHPDLFRALRFGSTNYGIVTRFNMTTFKTGQVWGGSRYFEVDDAQALLSQMAPYTQSLNKDPSAIAAVAMAYNNALKKYVIWNPIFSMNPKAWPSAVRAFQTIGKPVSDHTRIMNQVDATEEIHAAFPRRRRGEWWTLNIKADSDLAWEIYQKGIELFAPHLDIPGIEWEVVTQPFPMSMIKGSKKNGGNLSGLSEKDGDQFLMLGAAFWNNASDDAVMKKTLNQLLSWAMSVAKERGKLVRFIYLNYAGPNQDVLDSFGPANVKRMREVQRRYDPELLWPKYWQGGFRL